MIYTFSLIWILWSYLENGKLVTKLVFKYFYKKGYWRPKSTITIFILIKGITKVMKIWTQANKKYMIKYIYSGNFLPRNVRSKLSLDRINLRKEWLDFLTIFSLILWLLSLSFRFYGDMLKHLLPANGFLVNLSNFMLL